MWVWYILSSPKKSPQTVLSRFSLFHPVHLFGTFCKSQSINQEMGLLKIQMFLHRTSCSSVLTILAFSCERYLSRKNTINRIIFTSVILTVYIPFSYMAKGLVWSKTVTVIQSSFLIVSPSKVPGHLQTDLQLHDGRVAENFQVSQKEKMLHNPFDFMQNYLIFNQFGSWMISADVNPKRIVPNEQYFAPSSIEWRYYL